MNDDPPTFSISVEEHLLAPGSSSLLRSSKEWNKPWSWPSSVGLNDAENRIDESRVVKHGDLVVISDGKV